MGSGVRGTTGTPQYRAPEQVAGGVLGPAVDYYAMGILLHEMLTGRLPAGTGGGDGAGFGCWGAEGVAWVVGGVDAS